MRFAELVAVSRAVAETSGRLEKIGHLAALLARVPPAELAIVIPFLSGGTRQGRIGIGGALLSEMRDVPPAAVPRLDISDVDAAIDRLAALSGAGSTAARAQTLRELLGRATRDEQDFLIRLMFGELRQGALEGVLMDAVARAAGSAPARADAAGAARRGDARRTGPSHAADVRRAAAGRTRGGAAGRRRACVRHRSGARPARGQAGRRSRAGAIPDARATASISTPSS